VVKRLRPRDGVAAPPNPAGRGYLSRSRHRHCRQRSCQNVVF
jgi:hypothetical protein